MEQQQQDEQSASVEELEAPVRELTEDEAAQVEGGSRPGMGILNAQPAEPPKLKVKMSDILISG